MHQSCQGKASRTTAVHGDNASSVFCTTYTTTSTTYNLILFFVEKTGADHAPVFDSVL